MSQSGSTVSVDRSTSNVVPSPEPRSPYGPISDDPWNPIILSLDGGGIRGLSSLLILSSLMKKVAEKDAGRQKHYRMVGDQRIESSYALPCHYFDVMWGTSAGGLTAIMLGRLRMDLQDAINVYEEIGDKIFGHPRHLSLIWAKYSSEDFERLMKQIVKENCKDHAAEHCEGKDSLQQRDCEVGEGIKCRTAVVTREKRRTYQLSFTALRSYHHYAREGGRSDIKNWGPAAGLDIWKAGRATSAAPYFFSRMYHDDGRYVDGGIGLNNPCMEAYREGQEIARESKRVDLVVSVGTGHSLHMGVSDSRLKGWLGNFFEDVWDLGNFGHNVVTDTEKAHNDMIELSKKENFSYYRFNVDRGLEDMKMDEWHKKKRRWRKSTRPMVSSTQANEKRPNGDVAEVSNSQQQYVGQNSGSASRTLQNGGRANDVLSLGVLQLNRDGVGTSDDQPLGHQDPSILFAKEVNGPTPTTTFTTANQSNVRVNSSKLDRRKYDYTTLRTIERATNAYVGLSEIHDSLNSAADMLVALAQRRRQSDPERWARFVENSERRTDAGNYVALHQSITSQ